MPRYEFAAVMVAEWLGTTWLQAGLVVLSTACIYAAVIAVVRVNGLRSLSKMSAFDTATTIAVGTIFASVALGSASLANGAIALAVTFALQRAIAANRAGGERLRHFVDNRPTLLMVDGEFIDDGLRSCQVTRHDVVAKIRQSGVSSLDDVAAVVFETTGDISVLSSGEGVASIDPRLFDDVVGAERLSAALVAPKENH